MPIPFLSSTNPESESQARRFWSSFAGGDEQACRDALVELQLAIGVEVNDFSTSETSPSGSESLGKFVKIDLPTTSPKNAQDAWNNSKPTTLLRVDPDYHCLALDGDMSKYQGGEYFVACASPGREFLTADACSIGTHGQPKRTKFELSGPAYAIKVRASSMATKPKVLSGTFVLESSIPSELLISGIGSNILLQLEATPLVWKFILDNYPGKEQLAAPVPDQQTKVPTKTEMHVDTSSVTSSLVESVTARAETTFQSKERKSDEVPEAEADLKPPGLAPGAPLSQVSFEPSGYKPKFTPHQESLPTSPRGGDAANHPPPIPPESKDWLSHVQLVQGDLDKLRMDVKERFDRLDSGLEKDFSNVQMELTQLHTLARTAAAEAARAHERIENLGIPRSGYVHATRLSTPPPTFSWEALTPEDQGFIISQVAANLNVPELAEKVRAHLHLEGLETGYRNHQDRIQHLERELTNDQAIVPSIQRKVTELETRKDGGACERGGYLFKGPEEIDALVLSVGKKGKVYANCLDLYGLLTLASEAYTTYESGIKVHADAIKANFEGVQESRIKLSFEVPYPEIIIKSVENASTASKGGAKWAPMFSSAEAFESNFRDGAYRRVMNGVDRSYELVSKALDRAFPIAQRGNQTGDMRKLHTILADQNRQAYRQTTAFIDCLLPFYRTLSTGGLSSEEAWDRVLVFCMEFLTAVQEERVLACADFSDEAGIIWGCFKATDFVEEFRRQKFVGHPKALAILALTSIEREGKNLQAMEERVKKLIESAKGDKISKMETRLQTVENKVKNLITKNPDLK